MKNGKIHKERTFTSRLNGGVMKKKQVASPTRPSDKLIGGRIRLNKVKLNVSRNGHYADVVFIGDCHYGSPQFDQPRFLAMLNYCLRNNLYVLLMGDLLETATRHSVGAGVYEQTSNPDDQYDQMINWLR